MLRANLKWKLVARLMGSCLVLLLTIGVTSCEQSGATTPKFLAIGSVNPAPIIADGSLSEVNIPESIVKLAPSLDKYRPQVQILSPQPDQILADDRVSVKLRVSDLPIFKSAELGLGNHLHVILDKQTYQGIYNPDLPLVFENLSPGTHSLRVFASRPWHESFKNAGAYAQTTFHVLTKTPENNPRLQQPLLTYSRPTGSYGAEPILLDYYLTNAPAHLATGSSESIPDWRIRVTVNNQSFTIDRWEPIYLQGFKQGKNWIRLELIDNLDKPIENVYNDTLAIVTYNPQTKDTLAKLIRGELDPNLLQSLVDPHYVAAKPILLPVAPPPVTVVTPIAGIEPKPISSPVAAPDPALIVSPPPVIRSIPNQEPRISPPSPLPPNIPVPNSLAVKPPITTPVTQLPLPSEISIPIISPPVPPVNNLSPRTSLAPAPNVLPTAPAITPPSNLPAAIPTPLEIEPKPILTIRPTPIAMPAPTQEQTSVMVPSPLVSPQPERIVRPQPTPNISPTPISAPTLPLNGLASTGEIAPSPLPSPTISPVESPTVPRSTPPAENTWQFQVIELLKIAGVKTREFTNSIPPKAQRFGNNVQVWVGKAIEQIQTWQEERHNL